MNQSVPNSFYFILFFSTLIQAIGMSTYMLGMWLYGHKFPNKLRGKLSKWRRPKKYVIYAIYLNSACLIIAIFALLYSILNISQLVLWPLRFDLLYLSLAMLCVMVLPSMILELIYHLYWKQDFLNSQQEGNK